MAVFETSDVRCEPRRVAAGLQVRVTFCAGLTARSGDVDAPTVFGMTRRASRRWRLRGVMHGAVVAVEASAVGSLGGICASILQVTGNTFLFENGMRFRHTPARVHAMVSGKTAPRNPSEREQGQQETKPEFRALQRRRPLEIVEIDALREFFCCSCAGHVFLFC